MYVYICITMPHDCKQNLHLRQGPEFLVDLHTEGQTARRPGRDVGHVPHQKVAKHPHPRHVEHEKHPGRLQKRLHDVDGEPDGRRGIHPGRGQLIQEREGKRPRQHHIHDRERSPRALKRRAGVDQHLGVCDMAEEPVELRV